MQNSLRLIMRKTIHNSEGSQTLELDFTTQVGELQGLLGLQASTVLHVIAGLARPDEGLLMVDNQVWLDTVRGTFLPMRARNIGCMFPGNTLNNNATVEENLRMALIPNARGNDVWIHKILEATGLLDSRTHRTAILKRGDRQRLLLAQALVCRPTLLLLDDPYSGLNWDLRMRLQDELIHLHEAFQCTSLLGSLDVFEMMRCSNSMIEIAAKTTSEAFHCKA